MNGTKPEVSNFTSDRNIVSVVRNRRNLRGWSMIFIFDFFEENYYIWMAGVMTLLMYHKKVFFEKKIFAPPPPPPLK